MSVSTIEVTARKRLRRTRTRAVSALPALSVSTLRPHEYDLRPACISLVCPSCRTWVPITKPGTLRPKLVPHHMEEAGTEDPTRCPGSHRLVVLDMDIERWWQRLTEGVAETDGRRSNRVTRKPKVAVTPAVAQIVAPMLSTEDTLKLFRAHAQECTVCQESGHAHCPEGSPLACLYLYKLRNAPNLRTGLAIKSREELADQREQGLWRLRQLQWALTASAVRQTDIQRVHDALEMTLKQHSEKLNDWQQADLASAIATLATKLEQLHRL